MYILKNKRFIKRFQFYFQSEGPVVSSRRPEETVVVYEVGLEGIFGLTDPPIALCHVGKVALLSLSLFFFKYIRDLLW